MAWLFKGLPCKSLITAEIPIGEPLDTFRSQHCNYVRAGPCRVCTRQPVGYVSGSALIAIWNRRPTRTLRGGRRAGAGLALLLAAAIRHARPWHPGGAQQEAGMSTKCVRLYSSVLFASVRQGGGQCYSTLLAPPSIELECLKSARPFRYAL